jgi:membrane protease YdiL (CAAX protease family)
MRDWLQSLSYKTEFVIVILIGFGYFTVGAIVNFTSFTGPSPSERIVISNSQFYITIIYEILALIVIAAFLNIRNWSIADFNLKISARLTGAGILLALADYAILIVMFMLMSPLLSMDQNALGNFVPDFSSLNLTTITLISIINPIYEEVLVVGFVIAALKSRKGAWFAINTSVAIRLLYHFYQGPLALISIVPMGLLFAYVYIRFKRLWPLIVAHGIMDFIGLMAHSAT